MKTAAFVTSILASAMAVLADDNQSPPFSLQLTSDNSEFNGKYVGACHSGAAIESACISDQPVTMHLNTSSPNNFDNGIITWVLPSSIPVYSSLGLVTNPTSNVAQGIFEPGTDYKSYFSFYNDKLVLYSGVDDTKFPIEAGEAKPVDHWYICESYWIGYRYKTLSWVYGSDDAKPQNPKCVKVSVKRVYQ
ncbi:hypothetical protein NLG97_g3265 [Lecanicillium saksenae]|uniref:Uncharacterized protein n=1 Tax=Lecanicillium saksenae TaxID=468837 RepID=A0ACC1R0F6_9HYPO|nr:hypothetical protein NLG97_g3265 [Lecanicillium saksenae]